MKKSLKAISISVGVASLVSLAPISTYAAGYKMIPMSITFNDKKVSEVSKVMGFITKDPLSGKLTTFMPDWYITDLLQSTSIYTSWDGYNLRLSLPIYFSYKPMKAVPATSSPLRRNVYVNGVVVETPPAITAVDPLSHKLTTYLPIWYFQKILDAIGIMNVWHKPVWSTSWNNDGTPGIDHGLKYTKFWSGSSKITLANDPFNFGWLCFFDPIRITSTFQFPYDATFENIQLIRDAAKHQNIEIGDDEYQKIGDGEYQFFNGVTIQPQGNHFIISTPTYSPDDQFSVHILKANDFINEFTNGGIQAPRDISPVYYSLDGGTTWVSDQHGYRSDDSNHGGSSNPPSHVMVKFVSGTKVAINLWFSGGDLQTLQTLIAQYSNGKLTLELGLY